MASLQSLLNPMSSGPPSPVALVGVQPPSSPPDYDDLDQSDPEPEYEQHPELENSWRSYDAAPATRYDYEYPGRHRQVPLPETDEWHPKSPEAWAPMSPGKETNGTYYTSENGWESAPVMVEAEVVEEPVVKKRMTVSDLINHDTPKQIVEEPVLRDERGLQSEEEYVVEEVKDEFAEEPYVQSPQMDREPANYGSQYAPEVNGVERYSAEGGEQRLTEEVVEKYPAEEGERRLTEEAVEEYSAEERGRRSTEEAVEEDAGQQTDYEFEDSQDESRDEGVARGSAYGFDGGVKAPSSQSDSGQHEVRDHAMIDEEVVEQDVVQEQDMVKTEVNGHVSPSPELQRAEEQVDESQAEDDEMEFEDVLPQLAEPTVGPSLQTNGYQSAIETAIEEDEQPDADEPPVNGVLELTLGEPIESEDEDNRVDSHMETDDLELRRSRSASNHDFEDEAEDSDSEEAGISRQSPAAQGDTFDIPLSPRSPSPGALKIDQTYTLAKDDGVVSSAYESSDDSDVETPDEDTTTPADTADTEPTTHYTAAQTSKDQLFDTRPSTQEKELEEDMAAVAAYDQTPYREDRHRVEWTPTPEPEEQPSKPAYIPTANGLISSDSEPIAAKTKPRKKRQAVPKQKGVARPHAVKKRKTDTGDAATKKKAKKAAKKVVEGVKAKANGARRKVSSDVDDDDDDDDGMIYCVCRRPDSGKWMIACDGECEDWFHGECISIMEEDGELIDKYYCPHCSHPGRQTLWRRKCRLPSCRKPARTELNPPSKYCTDDHGIAFFSLQTMRSTIPASELATIVNTVRDTTDFRMLGKRIPTPPPTADDEMEALPEEQSRLEELVSECRALERDKRTLLQRKVEYLELTKARKERVFEELKANPETCGSLGKDICGYDERLSFDDLEWEDWVSSEAGRAVFGSGEIAGAEGVCTRKNCGRHARWRALVAEDTGLKEKLRQEKVAFLKRERRKILERMKRRAVRDERMGKVIVEFRGGARGL